MLSAGARIRITAALWVIGARVVGCRGHKALLACLHQRLACPPRRLGEAMVNLDSQPPPDIFTWHEVLRNVLALPRTAATKFVIVGLWPAHASE